MNKKILIPEYDYGDITSYQLVDINDLNQYVQFWVNSYRERHRAVAQVDYISHEVSLEHQCVNIKLHMHDCILPFEQKEFTTTFKFIDLEKITQWENKQTNKAT